MTPPIRSAELLRRLGVQSSNGSLGYTGRAEASLSEGRCALGRKYPWRNSVSRVIKVAPAQQLGVDFQACHFETLCPSEGTAPDYPEISFGN